MAKHRDDKPLRPTDEVRFTAIMTREQRARFKFFCERNGLEMERLGTEWILARLTEEERKQSRKG